VSLATPTGARLIALRSTPIDGSPLPSWPVKDPIERIVYGVDFAALVGPGLSIIHATASPSASIAAPATSWTGTVVSVLITGGNDGDVAAVDVSAVFSDDQLLTERLTLPIVARVSPMPPVLPGQLVVDGQPLAINGQPLVFTVSSTALTAGGIPVTIAGQYTNGVA